MKSGTEFWSQHVAAAKLEATSASSYAKRHGIAVSALYYWQRKLRSPTGASALASQADRFVALRVAEAVIAPRPCGCSLVLGSGVRLEMAGLPAPEWLAALVRAGQGVR